MENFNIQLRSDNSIIYLISDIHANGPALRATLEKIPDDAILICAGDVVGYYIDENDVCDLIKSRTQLVIKGNHDKYVLNELSFCESRDKKYRVTATRERMSEDNLNWLSCLSDSILIDISYEKPSGELCQKYISVYHGSAIDVEEYVYPDSEIELEDDFSSDFLILGHTHHPMERKKAGTRIINPGSIGQPRNWIPGASYASYDICNDVFEFHKANYDVKSYQSSLAKFGLEEDVINILSREK